jgi:hypothetical protein
MRIIFAVAATAFLSFAAICAPPQASAQTYGPDGSWQTSCRYPRMTGNTFSAECSASNGQWRRSYIEMPSCPGGLVGNNNGNLFCEGGGGRYEGNLPGGSWLRGCNSPHMSGATVHANCSTGSGSYQRSAFDMRNCPTWALGNNNGNLFCEGSRNFQGDLPGGSWQNSCNAPRKHGSVFTASCNVAHGGQRTTSIDLHGCPSRVVGNNDGVLYCERY